MNVKNYGRNSGDTLRQKETKKGTSSQAPRCASCKADKLKSLQAHRLTNSQSDKLKSCQTEKMTG